MALVAILLFRKPVLAFFEGLTWENVEKTKLGSKGLEFQRIALPAHSAFAIQTDERKAPAAVINFPNSTTTRMVVAADEIEFPEVSRARIVGNIVSKDVEQWESFSLHPESVKNVMIRAQCESVPRESSSVDGGAISKIPKVPTHEYSIPKLIPKSGHFRAFRCILSAVTEPSSPERTRATGAGDDA